MTLLVISGGMRTSVANETVCSQDEKSVDIVQEFRERTSSDPLQQNPTVKKQTLSRMTSLPVGGEHGLGLSSQHDLEPKRSPDVSQRSTGHTLHKRTEVVEEEDYDLVEPRGNMYDMEERQTESETTSVSSRESSLLPGQRNLLYTDSEDNRSVSNRSNMGDSGFC